MKRRPAAVAGSFYNGDRVTLREEVAALLRCAPNSGPGLPQALVVPHAGYIYSGATAAQAYRLLQNLTEKPSRIVLLGPAHRVYLEGMAVPGVDCFTTPLGDIPLHRDSLQQALGLPGVCESDEAHALEHSLEVQLPFLQQVLGSFSLVPIVVGNCPAPVVANLIDTLWGDRETLVIISTDLSHFHDYQTARQHDDETCQRILHGDSNLSGTDACGAAALNGLLASDHGRQLQRMLLANCNSGDTGGDQQRVVGYGAFALH